MTSTTVKLKHLKRLRWGVFAGVVLGILVSVATNVLHAEDNIISQLIAAWPPLALFGGIELISRIPSSNRWLSIGRVLATLAVAGVAGSLSYVHMSGTVEQYGEHGWRAAIWPITVDGLMLTATLSLVEVVAKIRQLESSLEEIAAPVAVQPPVVVTGPVVERAQRIVTDEVASLPVPVSPAPMSTEKIPGRGPVARRAARSPLTGNVLMEAAPKV
jgi:hypothetical protein